MRVLNELSHLRCDQLIFTNRLVRHFEASPWAVEGWGTCRACPRAVESRHGGCLARPRRHACSQGGLGAVGRRCDRSRPVRLESCHPPRGRPPVARPGFWSVQRTRQVFLGLSAHCAFDGLKESHIGEWVDEIAATPRPRTSNTLTDACRRSATPRRSRMLPGESDLQNFDRSCLIAGFGTKSPATASRS